MTAAPGDRGIAGVGARALYPWLLRLPPPELPRSAAILRALPELRALSGVYYAFLSLARQGHIDQRHGSPRHGRGHRIVRIVANGTVLRTRDCPLTFNDPPRQRARQVADLTVWRVLEVVEDCADRRVRLPNLERLGALVGRTAPTTRLALDALHDSGLLKLIRRGARWAAELPDGRSTL